MNVNSHIVNNKKIAEVGGDGVFIKRVEDALDLLGDLYYQGFDGIIIREQNITPDFFDLKTGIAGEILQKFSNYRVRLAIVGDFSSYKAKSICDFIYESNKTGHINFLSSVEEALKKISNTTS